MSDAAIRTEFYDGVGGARLALHRLGEGSPIVLLHGLFSSADMNWIRFGHAAAIAGRGYAVLMPDFRVHGESAAPQDAAAYPRDVLADDVAALVEHLGLESYDLGGFSLGARTTLHAVASGRLAPRRLVIGGMGEAGLSEWSRRADFFRRVIDEFETIDRDDPAYFSRQFLKSQGTDRMAARLLLDTMDDFDLARLDAVTQPTLVVCGAEDRDNGSAQALAARLVHADYAEVPGTHMSSVTKPDLSRAIASWLGDA